MSEIMGGKNEKSRWGFWSGKLWICSLIVLCDSISE